MLLQHGSDTYTSSHFCSHNVLTCITSHSNHSRTLQLCSSQIHSPPCSQKWKWSRSVVSHSLWPHGLTIAYQAPQSMGFSRQEYWSGLPFPSPGDLPNPGIEPRSPALQADALLSEPPRKSWGIWKNTNLTRRPSAQITSHSLMPPVWSPAPCMAYRAPEASFSSLT